MTLKPLLITRLSLSRYQISQMAEILVNLRWQIFIYYFIWRLTQKAFVTLVFVCRINDDSQSKETIWGTTIQDWPTKAPGELRPHQAVVLHPNILWWVLEQLVGLKSKLFKIFLLSSRSVSNLQIPHSTKAPTAMWPSPAGDQSHDPMQHSRSRYHKDDQHPSVSANLLLLSINILVGDVDVK